jgi:hypothetical protein
MKGYKGMSNKKKFQYTINLLLFVTLIVSRQGNAYAMPAAQEADSTNAPLFPDANWEELGSTQKVRVLDQEEVTLAGEAFTAIATFPDGDPHPVFDFYSSESLAALGWVFIGGVDVELAYKNEEGSILTVEVEVCSEDGTDYCLTVWLGEITERNPLTQAETLPFIKTTPANNATINVPTTTYQLLKWTDADAPDDLYEYCVDQTDNNSCDTTWIARNSLYSGGGQGSYEFPLSPGKTYYWQVRTKVDNVYANSGIWFKFKVAEYNLKKLTPANGAVIRPPANSYRFLTWSDAGPDWYAYCVDKTNNNTCDSNNWVSRNSLYSGGSDDIKFDEGTYYWQVRVLENGGIGADNGVWWSYTIQNFPLVYSITRHEPTDSTTGAETVKYLVMFTEDVTGVDISDFKLTTSGISGASIVSVTNFDSNSFYLVEVKTGAGTGWLRLSLLDNDSIKDVNLHSLGGPGTGNGNKAGEVYNIKRPLVVKSTAADDGWVLESSENSNVGGGLDNTSDIFQIGDNSTDSQYRSILSFRTGAVLPDTAVITAVTLKFKYAGVTGTLPFTTHGNLFADLSKGGFNGNKVLEVADFEAPFKKTKVLTYTDSRINDWYSQSLAATYFPFVSLTGITQFRLQFTKDDNDDSGADVLKIYSGNAASANRPQLIIEFYVP